MRRTCFSEDVDEGDNFRGCNGALVGESFKPAGSMPVVIAIVNTIQRNAIGLEYFEYEDGHQNGVRSKAALDTVKFGR